MDFKIGNSQALLLKAAFSGDKAEGAAALSEWWRNVGDFRPVRGTDSGIFPEIYWNLGARICAPNLAARLKGTARHQWIRNRYLIAICTELLDHLSGADIPALLLKGAAIAAVIDGDLGLRMMGDCDVLVPQKSAIDAVRILLSSGLIEKVNLHARDLEIVHGITLFHRRTGLGLLDLHWRPLRSIDAEQLSEEMFDAARPVRFAGRECLAPCPEHLLFHSIVHGTEWSPYPSYGWLIDVIKILRRIGGGFDWERLIDLASRYKYRFLVRSALSEARTRTGLAVPRWVERRLKANLALLERREARVRLSRPSTRSAGDELLLGLQKCRRCTVENLNGPTWRAGTRLLKSLFGAPFGNRPFVGGDNPDRVTLLYGWSAPEPTGRWTEGRFASLAIHAPEPPRPRALKLKAHPLRGEATPPQVVELFAGLRHVGTFAWPASGPTPYAQAIALPARVWSGNAAVLRLDIQTRTSPSEIDVNEDPRALGIFVEEISVDPPVRDLTSQPLDLTSDGADREALWHGWSVPEPFGCWTFGPLSLLRWRAAAPVEKHSMLLVEIAMLAPGLDELRGRFRLNELLVGSFRYTSVARFEALLQLPIREQIVPGYDMEFRIEVDNPRSPAEAIESEDRRPLGFAIRRIWIDPRAPARFSGRC